MTQVFDLCDNRDMNKTTKENIEFLTSVATLGFALPVIGVAKLTYRLASERKARRTELKAYEAQVAWAELMKQRKR